jgi:hypothetical protein
MPSAPMTTSAEIDAPFSKWPEADEHEIFLRTAARRLDRETMIRVYAWDPQSVAP